MNRSTLRVLLIDDEESDFLMTQALLGQLEGPTPEVEWASTFDQGLKLLAERRHDVCLLDYFLDRGTGVDLLEQARSQAIRTPIILLTGKGSRDVDLQAMKSGAADYLVKGTGDAEALERSLRYAVERHRAQEALRQSEERHRGMFDHLPLGLYRVTEEGEYIEANPALIRALEFPPKEMLGQVHARNFFVSPRDRERFLDLLREHGVVLGFESGLRTSSGRAVRIRNTARAHRGPSGVVEYVEGTVEDVSSDRPARETAAEAAAFRALRDSQSLGVLFADVGGRVVDANRAALSFLGTDSRQAQGTSLWDLFEPEDGVRIAAAVEAVTSHAQGSISSDVRLPPEGRGLGPRAGQATLFSVPGGGGESDAILVLIREAVSEPAT